MVRAARAFQLFPRRGIWPACNLASSNYLFMRAAGLFLRAPPSPAGTRAAVPQKKSGPRLHPWPRRCCFFIHSRFHAISISFCAVRRLPLLAGRLLHDPALLGAHRVPLQPRARARRARHAPALPVQIGRATRPVRLPTLEGLAAQGEPIGARAEQQDDRRLRDVAINASSACATSEHEEHVHGIELSFDAEEEAVCTIWYSEAMAKDEEAVSDLREDVAEAAKPRIGDGRRARYRLPLRPAPGACAAHADESAAEPSEPAPRRAAGARPSDLSSPDTSHSATPQLKRGMLAAAPPAHGDRPPRPQGGAAAQLAQGAQHAPAGTQHDSDGRAWRSDPRQHGRRVGGGAGRSLPDAPALGDLGDTVENGPIEALCVPAIST